MTLPAVQDGVRAFQAHPLGKMSVQLSNSAYQIVGAPVLSLLYKPLSYVAPYVQRVDELGDQTLSRVEEKYPVVKKSSPELFEEAKQVVYAPVQHVTSVYNRAYQLKEGGSAVATGKAAAKTAVFVWFEGACFVLRETIKFTDKLTDNEAWNDRLDKLSAAVQSRLFESPTTNGHHDEAADAEGSGAKASSA